MCVSEGGRRQESREQKDSDAAPWREPPPRRSGRCFRRPRPHPSSSFCCQRPRRPRRPPRPAQAARHAHRLLRPRSRERRAATAATRRGGGERPPPLGPAEAALPVVDQRRIEHEHIPRARPHRARGGAEVETQAGRRGRCCCRCRCGCRPRYHRRAARPGADVDAKLEGGCARHLRELLGRKQVAGIDARAASPRQERDRWRSRHRHGRRRRCRRPEKKRRRRRPAPSSTRPP